MRGESEMESEMESERERERERCATLESDRSEKSIFVFTVGTEKSFACVQSTTSPQDMGPPSAGAPAQEAVRVVARVRPLLPSVRQPT